MSFRRKAQPGGGSERSEVCDDEGQAIKSARGMPWHQEPMKDATSCEKPRGGAISRDPWISEWGNPARQYRVSVL